MRSTNFPGFSREVDLRVVRSEGGTKDTSKKMYSLRSGKSYAKQTAIEFPCRKRRQGTESTKQDQTEDENACTYSPPKRTKGMPRTRTRNPTKKRTLFPENAANSRSPLRQHNTALELKTPEKVGKEDVDSVTPTKKTPVAKTVTKRTALQEAKRSLHNSIPSTLLCRDEELASLSTFLQTSITARQPGALYISGAPGTGKTACLSHTMENSGDLLKSVNVVNINCMSVKQPQAIFGQIAESLLGSRVVKGQSHQESIEKSITSSRKMILIVLDEIDQLDCKSQEILYTLFEWPALPKSRLILIGIANALDLTDRILPRLQSHIKCRPQLLHFPPYTKDQIVTILQERLGSNPGTQTVVDPMAVQFCARKVSAVHGDLRKALDVCRRAIELVEGQERSQRLSEKNSEPPSKPLHVSLRHIASVMSEVYNPTAGNSAAQNTIPLQQKLVTCALILMTRGQAKKEVNVGKLQEEYIKLCQQRRLKFESESEFIGLCNMLATSGIIALKKGKETRLTKVTLKLEESELEHSLQDHTLMSSMLGHGKPDF